MSSAFSRSQNAWAGGKTKQPQRFSTSHLSAWRNRLETVENKQVSVLLEQVFCAQDVSTQVRAVKKVQSCLKIDEQEIDETENKKLMSVLVEMHSLCLFRHPLQRVLSSYLQDLSLHNQQLLSLLVTMRLEKEMAEEERMWCVQYVEALLEKFPSGEKSLMSILHKVLKFFSDVISDCATSALNKQPTGSPDLLSLSMKVLMNLLHHSTSLFTGSSDYKSDNIPRDLPSANENELSTMLSSLTCEDNMSMKKDKEVEFIRTLLQSVEKKIKELLIEGDFLSRDTLTSAAMLNVVMVATTCCSSNVSVEIMNLCENCYCTGTQFPTISQLCVAHSLLAKLSPHQHITITCDENQPLLLWLFPIIYNLFDVLTETPDRYIASRTLCLWSTAARESVTCDSVGESLCLSLAPSGSIVQKMLHYVWLMWEDPLESVRHQCKALFNNIVLIAKSLETISKDCSEDEGKFLSTLCHTLLTLPSTRGKYVLLTLLVPHLSVGVVLKEWPQLPSGILSAMGHQSLACKAGELWGKMVNQNYAEEEDKTKWQRTWIQPLVSVLQDGVPVARQHVKQYCLPSVLSTSPEALDTCIELLPHSSMSSLTARLVCLRSAISNSLHPISLVDTHIGTISAAICHKDEQVVASACALLCESKNTTEPPRSAHLDLVLECVELHINTQSAGFRYDLLSALKRLFNRISDSGHKLERLGKRGKTVCDDMDNIIASHKDFLKTIAERCFEVLHPLSTYQRRHFALSVLQLMKSVFSDGTSASVCVDREKFSQLVTKAQYRTLVYTLWDTFDTNRSIAVELLLSLPTHFSGLQDEGFLATAITSCYELISSPKSVSCVTGYYLTKLLIVLAPDKLTHQLIKSLQDSTSYDDKEATDLSSQLAVGWGLIGLLKAHITTASRDLVAASITTPMHGVLLAIRSVIESLHISTVQCSSVAAVKELLAAIINVCSELCAIVFPVVCNSSPEGFLPSCEVQPVENKLEKLEDGDGGIRGNAQSLLLCCWHCCKEMVAVMRVMVDQAGDRAATFRQETLLTSDQLEVISSLLLHLLTEARHRGAFEIASTGFTTLCRYLWGSPDPSLRSRPVEWMNELLSSLSNSTSLTQLLSITRRSAGLPFYVQAILTTEPLAHSRTCLSHAVTTLLSVAASHTSKPVPSSSIAPVPAAVHALNILRALYRESKLGEVMVSFIAEGVIVAVRGFSSSSWTIRNSSTLLLSALVTRIFGVKKVHEEHSMENKMSAHEFFTRFPSLNQFLLTELISASEDGGKSERLFPVLLVLSRLKPSPQLRNSSLHLIPPFLPPLISLAGCSVWKSRVLIAQSLVATLTSSNSSQLLLSLIDKMSCSHQNQLHGLLLMVINVVMESITMAQEREEQPLAVGGGKVLVCLLKKSHLGKRCNHCTITRALYLHCVSLILSSCTGLTFDKSTTESLHTLALDCQDTLLQDDVEDGSSYGPDDPSLAERQFQFLTTVKPVLATSLSTILPSDQLALQLLLQSPSNSVVMFLTQALQEGMLAGSVVIEGAVKLAMENKEQGYQLLCTIIEHNQPSKGIEGSLFQVFTAAVHAMHDGFMREELLIALLKFIQCSLKIVIGQQKSTSHKLLVSLLHQLREWCDETSSDPVRAAIAALIGTNWDIFVNSEKEDNGCSSSHLFWQMSVTLLQDVKEEVREKMCSSLSEMLSSTCSEKKPLNSVLCQQSTLRSLIASIPHIYQDKPASGISLLLSLIPTDLPQTSQQDPVSRLLFNEDKTNAFAEEAELLQLIWKEAEKLLPLITDKELLYQLVGTNHENSQVELRAVGNPWIDPTLFCGVVKNTLLVNALQMKDKDGWSQGSDHISTCIHPLLDKLNTKIRQ